MAFDNPIDPQYAEDRALYDQYMSELDEYNQAISKFSTSLGQASAPSVSYHPTTGRRLEGHRQGTFTAPFYQRSDHPFINQLERTTTPAFVPQAPSTQMGGFSPEQQAQLMNQFQAHTAQQAALSQMQPLIYGPGRGTYRAPTAPVAPTPVPFPNMADYGQPNPGTAPGGGGGGLSPGADGGGAPIVPPPIAPPTPPPTPDDSPSFNPPPGIEQPDLGGGILLQPPPQVDDMVPKVPTNELSFDDYRDAFSTIRTRQDLKKAVKGVLSDAGAGPLSKQDKKQLDSLYDQARSAVTMAKAGHGEAGEQNPDDWRFAEKRLEKLGVKLQDLLGPYVPDLDTSVLGGSVGGQTGPGQVGLGGEHSSAVMGGKGTLSGALGLGMVGLGLMGGLGTMGALGLQGIGELMGTLFGGEEGESGGDEGIGGESGYGDDAGIGSGEGFGGYV